MNTYQHLLVAVDFTESIGSVIERAQKVAQSDGAKLSFIHVIEPAPVDFLDQTMLVDINIDELLKKAAAQQLQNLAKKYAVDEADCYLEVGSVKNEIFKRIDGLSVDLLVIGSHGRHGLALLLGSTANAVLHGANCDVLAVRVND